MRARQLLVGVVATSLVPGLAGCGRSSTARPALATSTTATAASPPPGETPISGTIEVYDQTTDGTFLTVKRATLSGRAGWVVVHLDEGGPGQVIACSPIPEGTSTDVTVQLTTRVGTGLLWPMLHRDAGEPGVCEWPGGPDGPVRPPDGSITFATRKIMLTVEP